MLLRNWLVSAEMQCWYPHDDVTVRSRLHFRFKKNKFTRKLSMLCLLMCWSHMFWNTFSQLKKNVSWNWTTFFSHFLVLTACLCLDEAAYFITFNSCLMLTFLSPTRNACKSISCTRPSLYPYLPSFDTNKIFWRRTVSMIEKSWAN